MEASPPGGRRPSTHDLRTRIFADAARIVAAEFPRPLTVDEVAHRVATSPRQLQRAFSEVGGVSFRDYLRRVRMLRGTELLVESDLAVSEIARRVGYREPSQFSKAFKRMYGCTPSERRTACRGAPE